jgi:YHS domain-containing protein
MNMKLVSALSLVAVMAMGLMLAAGCTETSPAPTAPASPAKTSTAPSATSTSAAVPAASEIAQKLCPVSDDPIDPNIYVDYKGQRIYFCCPLCPPKFNADPEMYLKKMAEQMKAGAGAAKSAAATATASMNMVVTWTCPMHPEVRETKAGKCPKCGMPLVPMSKDVAPMPTGTMK